MIVNIEINGKELQAENGQMLIEVADELGINIPRFCYHKNLSISANCRMCLVEVEKAPKPMPACATPVTDGMKVFTKSPKALAAQKAVMEFLLINHPLDCPVCDQGGECDLQDFSMGYGEGNSQYVEVKRVIKDKNIGPLVATEMTRCIQCTRCVRFGQEVAGIRELGATGRGENMEIGTYIEKSVDSELSGNIIDICPVGALTSKPFRYNARSWEMEKHSGIAAHDCVGSNVEFHTLRGEIQRVIARENKAINDTWISDRDRFSYLGLNHKERLLDPMIKKAGKWEKVNWEEALSFAAELIKNGLEKIGADSLGAIISPSATVEEFYLAQKIIRAMGSENIDHRTHQIDTRLQDKDPVYPGLDMPINELSCQQSFLIIGSNIRKEQPMIAHQVRKAVVARDCVEDANVMLLNPTPYSMNFPIDIELVPEDGMIFNELLSLAKVLVSEHGVDTPSSLSDAINEIEINDAHKQTISNLRAADKSIVIIGSLAQTLDNYSQLRTLAGFISKNTSSKLGFLSYGANSAGAYIAGAIPHREACQRIDNVGLSVQEMLANSLTTYLIQGVEVEEDIINGPASNSEQTFEHLEKANTILLSSYVTDKMKEYATVMLPTATYTESSGTFINVSGVWQSVNAITEAKGDSKPAWKILRVLGNLLDVNNMDYVSSEDVKNEVLQLFGDREMISEIEWSDLEIDEASKEDVSNKDLMIYAVDSMVRRSQALQETADGQTVHNV